MENQALIKQQLVKHIKGGQAFAPIDTVLDNMPYKKIGIVPDGLPYSFYQLFYHIRFAQSDILGYCLDDGYQAPNWPDDYWPEKTVSENEDEWHRLMNVYFDEREEFCDLLLSDDTQLMAPFKSNESHNMLRQAELIIEHSAYHTGQLYIIYRLLNG